jgi:squalene-hopene/tetraprenyl-beta-curcumene cyclase
MKTELFLIITLFLLASCQTNKWTTKALRAPAQDEEQALRYMDKTTKNWLDGVSSHGGKCMSCHTTLPYAMARPAHGQSEELLSMRTAIEERVKLFDEVGFEGNVQPWYESFKKSSYSNESVMNAITLVYMDKGVAQGTEELGGSTKTALKLMWERQVKDGEHMGGFDWLDQYGFAPFENKGSAHWGTAMVAVAIGEAPENYKNNPLIQENIANLRKYLQKNFDDMNLHHQLVVAWADKEIGGILSGEQVKEVTRKVLASQAEGGWSIHNLLNISGHSTVPDGYATGLVTNIMMKLGKGDDVKVKGGLSWIRNSQTVANTGVLASGMPSCGSWFGMSPNSHKQSLFFTDLSTSYAMLALQTAKKMGH